MVFCLTALCNTVNHQHHVALPAAPRLHPLALGSQTGLQAALLLRPWIPKLHRPCQHSRGCPCREGPGGGGTKRASRAPSRPGHSLLILPHVLPALAAVLQAPTPAGQTVVGMELPGSAMLYAHCGIKPCCTRPAHTRICCT
jgi:hypothetical protein